MLWVKTAGNGVKKNIPQNYYGMSDISGGWGGIRTPGRVAPSAVFKTVAFDRSATHPKLFHFYPPVFQTCGFVCDTSFGNCARIFYIYFLRIATVKIVAPATNIIADNNCPIVSPQLVKKPIWTSGARNCSQNMRATAYPIPNIPPKAPA